MNILLHKIQNLFKASMHAHKMRSMPYYHKMLTADVVRGFLFDFIGDPPPPWTDQIFLKLFDKATIKALLLFSRTEEAKEMFSDMDMQQALAYINMMAVERFHLLMDMNIKLGVEHPKMQILVNDLSGQPDTFISLVEGFMELSENFVDSREFFYDSPSFGEHGPSEQKKGESGRIGMKLSKEVFIYLDEEAHGKWRKVDDLSLLDDLYGANSSEEIKAILDYKDDMGRKAVYIDENNKSAVFYEKDMELSKEDEIDGDFYLFSTMSWEELSEYDRIVCNEIMGEIKRFIRHFPNNAISWMWTKMLENKPLDPRKFLIAYLENSKEYSSPDLYEVAEFLEYLREIIKGIQDCNKEFSDRMKIEEENEGLFQERLGYLIQYGGILQSWEDNWMIMENDEGKVTSDKPVLDKMKEFIDKYPENTISREWKMRIDNNKQMTAIELLFSFIDRLDDGDYTDQDLDEYTNFFKAL